MNTATIMPARQTIAIITGDIVNSTDISGNNWVNQMQEVLKLEGAEDTDWTIFGGDSFQMRINQPTVSISKAIFLYAEMYGKYGIEIRQSIGIGDLAYDSGKLATSNGSAFRYSGRGLKKIGKNRITVVSESGDFDLLTRTMLSLAEKIMESWTSRMAYIFYTKMNHPEKTQKELARILDVGQSVISESLSRSGYREIEGMLGYLKQKMTDIWIPSRS